MKLLTRNGDWTKLDWWARRGKELIGFLEGGIVKSNPGLSADGSVVNQLPLSGFIYQATSAIYTAVLYFYRNTT